MSHAPSPRRLKVAVVDDHPVFRRGLADLVAGDPRLVLCGEAASIAEALEVVAVQEPDVVIVDLSLGSESGLDLVRAVASAHPGVRMLVLSGFDERLYAGRALEAGAHGYIMKDQAGSELLDAIHRVAQGRTYVSAASAERILSSLSRRHAGDPADAMSGLSARERQVLALLAHGVSTRDIASTLSLSIKTVESHYAHMKTKLGLQSVRQLTLFAARIGGEPPG